MWFVRALHNEPTSLERFLCDVHLCLLDLSECGDSSHYEQSNAPMDVVVASLPPGFLKGKFWEHCKSQEKRALRRWKRRDFLFK